MTDPQTVTFAAGCRSCRTVREFTMASWEEVDPVKEALTQEGWKRDRRGFHYCPNCEANEPDEQ